MYFTILGKSDWQFRIDSIVQNMSELERLRSVLLTKQERFESKLKNVSAVEKRSQTFRAV